jgi:hypothetical protein
MKKQMFFFLLAIALFWSNTHTFAQDQVPAPAFKEGDTWQFNISRQDQIASSTAQNEGLYEIIYTQGKAVVFKIDGSQKTEVDISPDSPGEGLLGAIGKNARRPDLKFPLSVGEKWNYEVTVRPAGARQDQRRSAEVTVMGQEQVTTPAGSFKAYKLVRSESWSVGRAGKGNSSTSTFFYSLDTRSIVKRVTENSNNPGIAINELIKFTPGN